MRVLIDAFAKKYGVKMQFWRASSESILRRALIEQRAGRYEVDAIETSAAEMESLHREGMLQEVRSPHLADIVPAALRPHREWVGDRLNIISAGYNTKLVRKDELPKTYEDFADPRWKGRLGIESDDAVWFGALANALGEDKVVKLFRDMVRVNGVSVRKGHTLLANLVVSGRGAVRAHALSLQGRAVEERRRAARLVRDPARLRALPRHRRDASARRIRTPPCCSSTSCCTRRSSSWSRATSRRPT